MAGLLQTYYEQAQLSDAAYATLRVGMSPEDYERALRDRGFTIEEAADFAGKYAIVDVFSDDETSFYAVLFQEKDANGNLTNKKTLAIRGTADPFDLFITDQQLALLGATSQDFSMRASYADILAELAPADVLTVTGHSLGGFLAQAFANDFPYPISHAYTYNGAGLGSFLSNPFGLLGISKSIPNDRITNLVGQGQTLVASTGTQLGSKQNIFIEEMSVLVNPIANHLIEPLKDSLALYDVFGRLDPTLSIETITNILNAVSSVPSRSLERGIDGLRTIFQGLTAPLTPTDDRVAYYNNLFPFRASLPSGPVSPYRMESLVGTEQSAASLAKSQSSEGLAYRYALRELNPFVVVGVDYGLHNVGGALDLYDALTGNGTMTALYLSDRTVLLAEKNAYGLADGTPVNRSTTLYEDQLTGFNNERGATATEVVIFGDVEGRELVGRSGNDYLYGGGGNDILTGGAGQDYLEGGTGNDELHGGSENDILLGQQGNDELYGEADNDRLNGGLGDDKLDGGTGLDTYFYRTGQGQDRILDSDKVGAIVFDNQTLVGGIRRQDTPAGTWVSPDSQFTFVRSGTDLVINSTLTLDNFDFATGALGIKLADTGDLIDGTGPVINYDNGQATVTYVGDETDNWPIFDAAANHVVYGNGGNDVLNFEGGSAAFNHQIYGGDGHDELHGGAGQDRIYGDAGRDLMVGVEGDDVLDGGGDIDLLKGGLGQDVLYGEAGNDGLDGGSGDDVLFGGAGNDVLSGESIQLGVSTIGNDYLDGEAGDDWVLGLRGDDVLYGGIGADHLYGDQATSEAPNFELAYPGTVTVLPGVSFNSMPGGADYLDGGEGADYLQGDGGHDVLLGGEGVDELWGDDQQIAVVQEGDDWLEGGAGNDQLVGGGGEDALFGGDDDDVLVGDYANNPSDGFADTLDGGAGNDELQAGGGDDLLDGGSENDRLFGEDGDDSLYGGTGDDQLQGGAGDDILFGDDGNDQLSGGAGLDDLAGGTGDDVLFGGDADDTLFGEEDADELQGGAGNDILVGNVGNDRLFGDAGNDQLFGDEGDDVLDGGEGDNVLFGGDGHDQLIGGSGADQVHGGVGNDVLAGGGGADTYVIGLGDGIDMITDSAGEENWVMFVDGITFDDVAVSFAPTALVLRLGPAGNQLSIGEFNASNALAPSAIASYQFADGTVLTHAALVERGAGIEAGSLVGWEFSGRLLVGGSDNDWLGATTLNDLLSGAEGDDLLAGLDGDDVILGGAGRDELVGDHGNDVLEGGAGDDYLDGGQFGEEGDTYRYNLGDGLDIVFDGPGFGSEVNRLQFGAGITSASLSIAVVEGLLTIRLGSNGAGVQFWNTQLENVLGRHDIQLFSFADSTSMTYEQLVAQQGLIDVMGSVLGYQEVLGTNLGDRVFAGAGDQFLFGGEGNDTYLFNLGDGIDRIEDVATLGEGNRVQFGVGIRPIDLTFTEDSVARTLTIQVGSGTDQLVLMNFDPTGVNGSLVVETLAFADGSEESLASLIGPSITIFGTEAADVLVGTVENDGIDAGAGPDTIYAGAGDDLILAGAGDDVVAGEAGVDTIHGGSGVDYLYGGDGDDLINGDEDTDVLVGDAGHDTLTGGAGNDVLNGGIGNDHLIGGDGDDTIYAGVGDDLIEAGDGNDAVVGEGGADAIYGGAGADYLYGGDGDDLVNGDDGSDVLVGEAGNDSLNGGLGDDVLNGGDGEDVLSGEDGNDTVHAGAGTDLVSGGSGDDAVNGDDGADTMSGGIGADSLYGGNGDDSINGDEGNDTLVGGDGLDVLAGGAGSDVLKGGIGADQLYGEDGDDTLYIDAADTVVNGGNGYDVVVVTGIDGVTFDVAGAGIELMAGSVGNDVFTAVGSSNSITFYGGDGTDQLTGGNANDVLVGDGGDDLLSGGDGNDVLNGGVGDDTLTGGAGDDAFYAGAGTDLISGGDGTDSVSGDEGNDVIAGGADGDYLYGGIGDDVINGDAGNDVLVGEADHDTLVGGAGNDRLVGGTGNDVYCVGIGGGSDVIAEDDSTSGNQDLLQFDSELTPLDLVLSQQANDLRIAMHGTADQILLENWFMGEAYQVESLEAGTGVTLLNSQVDQLIQAMASFSQQTGLTWDQAIDQRPQEVQAVLAASWQ